ncbi:MAG: hypothetical protein GTN53_44390 [Candidatus Aminicenantes bacterium]|nr:hypothetical protein [Candidatus Aminicenantes bacterium]NIQ73478.1 hypothetical protein [Candidatus Aminicenantes bacterium]NIT29547.1 hypothetical protein [Candidatus Aminicenantes bacterium]
MKQRCFTINVNMIIGFFIVLVIVLHSPLLSDAAAAEKGETVQAVKASPKPKIDGVLDDKVWQTPPLKKDFITYYPIYGEKLPYETRVWVSYDSKNLYFAFLCFDPAPEKIQTSITKRDNVLNDDWVSVSVDAEGNDQAAYVLYVNPNGIQGDALASSVGDEDLSPDFVWDSAARVTESGYQVEICLPLKSIRFKSGKEVKMGILFRRKITGIGYTGAWPDIKLGHNILESQTKAVFKELRKQLRFEILPSLTDSNNRVRLSPEEWSESDTATEFGIGLKYGITSSITTDIAINPDFSQVESDAFQVEVNQRYPLFYSEKRPFFMEGVDIFNFYTYPYGYFTTPVHTRRILDPAWGAKLTGNIGKITFGILSAGDEWPGQSWETGTNPDEGKDAFFGIARGKYSLGKNNYIGFIYSGREFAGEYNRVFGADFVHRIGKHQRIQTSFLHSISGDEDGRQGEAKNSSDLNLVYRYDSKLLFMIAAFEHIGKDFRMDTSFLRRRGINNAVLWGGIAFYPDPKKMAWLKMISPDFRFEYTHGLYTNLNDMLFNGALYFFTTKEGMLILNYRYIKENWEGQEFNLNRFIVNGGIRLNKWLKIDGYYSYGERIYYQGAPPFKGKGSVGAVNVELQPGEKINQLFSFTHSDLSGQGEEVYDVNILYSRTTYQFSKYFFLRAVIQYESFQKRLLTDLLASFTLIPGTVLHVGYGGLYENRKWQDNQWIYREGEMINTKRSFFAKVSYLWRF